MVDDRGNVVEGNSGILQMYDAPPGSKVKEWRYVCDDKFSDNEHGPNVACNELGYNAGTERDAAVQITWVYWDNIMCDGSESSLANCQRPNPGSCGSSEAVYLICSGGT